MNIASTIKTSLVISLILLSGLLFSCTKKPSLGEGRFLSTAISCKTDTLCFSIVDSLLWKSGNQALTEKLEWNPLSRADTIINFHEYTNIQEQATILVLNNFQVEKEGTYILRLGSDDGFRIFVNSKNVASRIIGRSLQLDSDWIPIQLREGNNRIIIQVNQGIGDWKLHYRIDKGEHLESLVADHIIEIYRDLTDLNIIPDTSTALTLDKDPRQHLDRWHSITYRWIHPETGQSIQADTYAASEAPNTFDLPDGAPFPILFKYSVQHTTGPTVYAETIPIFSEQSVERNVTELYETLHAKPGNNQWTRGLELVFPEYTGTEQKHSYSTRIKTEFLWDVLIRDGHPFAPIGGPRMESMKGLISRIYKPDLLNGGLESTTGDPIQVLGINPQPKDSVSHYLSAYHGHTHNTLEVRSSYARYFNAELTFPFIKQYTETNNLAEVMNHYIKKLPDSTRLNIIAWSNSVPLLLEVLGSRSVRVDHVALLGSYFTDQPTERYRTIQLVKRYNPDIKWYIWHGEEDEVVPIGIAENWVAAIKAQGFNVYYKRLPLTDHEVYFTDPRKKFYGFITTN